MAALLKGLLGPRSSYSKKLEGILGFRPANEFYYELAFRHSSMPETNKFRSAEGSRNNQRLEFLGDALLSSICSDVLYRHFPGKDEGFLSGMRSKIVNREHLNTVAEQMGIPGLLAAEKSGIRRPTSIYGDALEALIGAVYLDRGLDTASEFVHRLFDPLIATASGLGAGLDWKTSLQELTAAEMLGVPEYHVDESGPDHQKTFRATVRVAGESYGLGEGRSKKEAEQQAAESAWKAIKARSEAAGNGKK
jgi:ribonuclease III